MSLALDERFGSTVSFHPSNHMVISVLYVRKQIQRSKVNLPQVTQALNFHVILHVYVLQIPKPVFFLIIHHSASGRQRNKSLCAHGRDREVLLLGKLYPKQIMPWLLIDSACISFQIAHLKRSTLLLFYKLFSLASLSIRILSCKPQKQTLADFSGKGNNWEQRVAHRMSVGPWTRQPGMAPKTIPLSSSDVESWPGALSLPLDICPELQLPLLEPWFRCCHQLSW